MPHPPPRFVKLSHADFVIEFDDEDVRGRDVLSIEGERIGHIDDLIIDTEDSTVRFLEVGTGGILGIGQRKSLIPVEAVSKVEEYRVIVERSQQHVASAPIYNPHVLQTEPYLSDLYEHYGYIPPWTPGAASE